MKEEAQVISEKEEILFVKSIDNIMSKNYLNFMQVCVKPLSVGMSKLTVIIDFDFNSSTE